MIYPKSSKLHISLYYLDYGKVNQGQIFWGGAGGVHPPKFSSTPSEKFENGVHTVGYYFYYRFYLKKLLHLAVRVQLTDNFNKYTDRGQKTGVMGLW